MIFHFFFFSFFFKGFEGILLGFLVIYAIAFIYILLTADNFFSFSPISAYAEIVLNLPRALQQIFQQRSPTLWFMYSDLYKAIEEIVLAAA